MKKIIILTIALLTIIPVFLAYAKETYYNPVTNDYRPLYNFTYDVFKYLPPFPKDFYAKEQLFSTQQITASRLTDEYLQPEILPSWSYLCERAYGDSNPHYTGMYGVNLYPSRFDVFNIEVGESVNISTLLYTPPGIEIYQGVCIEPSYNNSKLRIILKQPQSKYILLYPTYPCYNSQWCQIIEYKITLLQPGNHTIEFYETLIPEEIDQAWREDYKGRYTSGGSILSLEVPKMKIFLYGIDSSENNNVADMEQKDDEQFETPIFYYLFIIIIMVFAWGIFYARIRKKRAESKRKKEN